MKTETQIRSERQISRQARAQRLQRQAEVQYNDVQSAIRCRLAAITKLVDAHAKAISGPVNFGHVGDVMHVAARLAEIESFLRGEG